MIIENILCQRLLRKKNSIRALAYSVNFAIVGAIIAIIVGIAIVGVMSSQESDIVTKDNTIEITENNPEEIDPDIQKKLDDITNTVEENDGNISSYDSERPRDWVQSGPFQIDRKEYALGENVFVRTGVFEYTEKGQIAFLRPLNTTHYEVHITIPFDGLDKNFFNQYFKPALSKARGICTVDDLAGEWKVVFRGTDYPDITFTINDKITVPGEEENYQPVC